MHWASTFALVSLLSGAPANQLVESAEFRFTLPAGWSRGALESTALAPAIERGGLKYLEAFSLNKTTFGGEVIVAPHGVLEGLTANASGTLMVVAAPQPRSRLWLSNYG